MATQYPKLVNKQFNSPIKLYSQQNVQEILDKESQILANGAVGIDFHQLAKPANLKNSAVLRMLEEEENRKRNGLPGDMTNGIRVNRLGNIKWPPDNVNNNTKLLNNCGWSSSKLCFVKPGGKQVIWPPPLDSEEYNNNIVEEAPVYAQGGGQYHTQQASPVQQLPQRNKVVSPSYQQQQQHQQPQQQQQPLSPQFGGQQQQQQAKGWAPVQSPVSVNSQSPQFNQPSQQQQPQSPYQQPYRPPVVVPEPPPATITLRPEPPISQSPAPIYTSQPATASLNGGNNMRGDQKWPPANVKTQIEAENDMRKQLAKGPAFRPRKVKKDYSAFFAQHALNSTYPGYRAPPGTQYYTTEQSGVTNF